MVILEGAVRHVWNGRSVLMRPGDAVFVAERDEHSLAAAGSRVRLINLAFPCQASELLSGLEDRPVYRSVFSVRLNPVQVERFIEYAQALVPPAGKAALAEFLLWFSRVAAQHSPSASTAEQAGIREAPPPWFSDLISWVELPGRAPPSLGELRSTCAAASGASATPVPGPF